MMQDEQSYRAAVIAAMPLHGEHPSDTQPHRLPSTQVAMNQERSTLNDISDALAHGGSVAELEQIFEHAPEYAPSEYAPSGDPLGEAHAAMHSGIHSGIKLLSSNHHNADGLPSRFPWARPGARYPARVGDRAPYPGENRACLIDASTVQPAKIEWLWHYRLPRGKIVVIDGDPGLGKSTVLLDLAARVSTGGWMPDGEPLQTSGAVLLLSAEDGIGDTIIPRLEAAGADRTRIIIFEGVALPDGTTRPPTLPDDFDLLQQTIIERKVVLVVIDPLMAFLSGGVDSHKDQDIRRVLHRLKGVADHTNATIIICRHLTKTSGANPLYRGGGSIGIIGAARVAMLVAPDPDADLLSDRPPRRIIAVSKSNVGGIPPALAYRVETDLDRDCSRIAWDGTTEHKASDLVMVQTVDAGERSALREAVDFLREMLGSGERLAKDVESEATALGIDERTLRRARKTLGVRAAKEKRANGRWLWSLPAAGGFGGSTDGSSIEAKNGNVDSYDGAFGDRAFDDRAFEGSQFEGGQAWEIGQMKPLKFGEKGEGGQTGSKGAKILCPAPFDGTPGQETMNAVSTAPISDGTTLPGEALEERAGDGMRCQFEGGQALSSPSPYPSKFSEKGEGGQAMTKGATHTDLAAFENVGPLRPEGTAPSASPGAPAPSEDRPNATSASAWESGWESGTV